MSLSEGLYTIESQLTGSAVGRNPTEDRSLLPKRVVVHPKGATNWHGRATWSIKPNKAGTYRLLNVGGLAIAQDKALWAQLLDSSAPVFWKIEAQTQHGANVYTITVPEGGDGWKVADAEDWSQLAVGPLVATKSIPPFYHASGIYTITAIERSEE